MNKELKKMYIVHTDFSEFVAAKLNVNLAFV